MSARRSTSTSTQTRMACRRHAIFGGWTARSRDRLEMEVKSGKQAKLVMVPESREDEEGRERRRQVKEKLVRQQVK